MATAQSAPQAKPSGHSGQKESLLANGSLLKPVKLSKAATRLTRKMLLACFPHPIRLMWTLL